MSAPGEPTTIRERLEVIRDATEQTPFKYEPPLAWIDDLHEHAVAALAILDNAKIVADVEGIKRIVIDFHPDPVRLVGRVEPHDDNGDTT